MGCVRLVVLFWACLAMAGPVWAQRATAAVEGSARDDAGAATADVTITAQNRETGLRRAATTGPDGRYVIASLPVEGEYDIRAELAGFAPAVHEHVLLLANQTVVIDFALKVAAQELVVVSSAEVAIDREHSTVQQTVDESLVRSLPLFGRGFIPLASLAAGFTGSPDFPSSQGQAYWTNNVLVDGASHFSKWRSAARSIYSGYGLESVKQVEVLTNLFSAEFGEALASVTSVTTKAGTNVRHGSALLFARDDALDAVPPFAARKPPAGALQFGFSLGGPLVVDRTHFFGSYEGRRSRDRNIAVSPAALNAEVPDDQDEHLIFFRVDHQSTSRQLLTARYNGQLFHWRHEPGGLTLPGSGTEFTTRVHTLLMTDALQISNRAVNELRFQFARYVDVREDLRSTVFISRAGYSLEGGAVGPRGFGADPEDTWEASDTLSFWRWGHALRLGGGFKHVRAHNASLTYGRGAYFFAGPPDRFPQPYLFVQSLASTEDAAVADPRSVSASGFVQDDWRMGSGLTLNLGLRYDVEDVFNVRGYDASVDANNFQPRVGVVWDIDAQTVVRGGIGTYTQQQLLYPINRVQLEGPDGAVAVSLTPGSALMPIFPAALAAFAPGLILPPRDLYRVDAAFRNPYAIQSAIGAQRVLPWVGVLAADYVYLSGRDLMSLIDANAPASVQKPAQRTVEQADLTRPLVPAPSTYRKIITLGNQGRSWYRALQIKLHRGVGPIQAIGSYTLSRALDMASYELPEASRDLSAEKGRAATDIRHNLTGGFTWELPGEGRVRNGWSLSGIGVVRSNRPYTVSWGDDRNGTTQSDARPDGRNTGKTGPYRAVDLALAKHFRHGATVTEGRVEAFNVFNATNYDQYVGELQSPLFSRPVSAFPQRRLQLAVIVRF